MNILVEVSKENRILKFLQNITRIKIISIHSHMTICMILNSKFAL